MLVWAFGLISSPFVATLALRKCSRDHGRDYDPEVSKSIVKSTYVDDWLRSTPVEENGCRLIVQTPHMLRKGGFRLTKLSSNSAKILSMVPEEEKEGQARPRCCSQG